MPLDIGNEKRGASKDLVEKVWNKTSKLVQALPVYLMSCFLFPESVIKKIESCILKFWWGADRDKGTVHWMGAGV